MAQFLRYEPASRAVETLLAQHVIRRIWARDVSVWSGSADAASRDEVGRAIANRLGWLDAPAAMQPHASDVEAFAAELAPEGIQTIYLLGMGGSSLCAEVIGAVSDLSDGHPRLVVMDTTDEATIHAAAARLEPARTLFLVASKSGGTIEVASQEKLFWQHMSSALGARAGRHFVAITDPGTALEQLAADRGYRRAFINPPDIGGRFSALSLFGLVPAALITAPAHRMLAAAADMAAGCRQEHHLNPGLELGAFIGAAANAGRDKLTVLLPPSMRTLGLWIEQLVAESTGKHDKGALPVVDEPIGGPSAYGADRCFVALSTERDGPDMARVQALEDAGHPVLRISTRVDALGAEFFRWEFATAVAGAVLAINPFDEPNVAEAKDKTKAILAKGDFTGGTPAASASGVSVYSSRFSGATPAQVVRNATAAIGDGDYAAFLSYLPPTAEVEAAVLAIREGLHARTRAASTFGVGPRYLHSTGQYHKGGPNTIVAFVLTGEDATETPIPGAPYSFKQLKRAQAVGDYQTLEAHDRRTVRIHFDRGVDAASALRDLFAATS
jgi:glucose-6-phosphate isomerase/transaldolase/glucose-6-phosphate isomerase